MIKNVGQTVFRLAVCGLLAFVFSCQKNNRLHSPTAQNNQTSHVIEDDLTPTSAFEDSDEPIVKDGITYQAPQKKIKNAQAELLVGRVKFDKSKFLYDPSTHQLRITGVARVLDENKKEIGSTEFDISGSHDVDENRILLKEASNVKINSSEKPLVRAKVTCLSINDKDEYDCSRSVIDFFISFKKQKYTEQMELAQKTKKPDVQPPTPPTQTPTVSASGDQSTTDGTDDDGLQSEGKEDSIDGRFQGHAETADLKKVFEGDEDDDIPQPPPKTDNPPIVVAPTTPPTTAATSTPTTSTPPRVKPAPTPRSTPPVVAPPVVTPPVVTTPATPVTPAIPDTSQDKPEKQLTKDLQQLKNGDVRQINQAIGFPDNGKLRNATSVLTKQQAMNDNAFFEVVSPASKRHFATYEMAELISRMGKNLMDIYNHKLFVGNISQQTGGKISPHQSHQIGVDADLGYPTTSDAIKFPVVVQMKNRQYNPSSYSIEKTYALLKYTFSQQDIKVDRIFMDRTIKKALCDYAKSKNEFNSSSKDVVNTLFNSIDHVDGHGDHFHVRLKCSSYDPGCRQKIYAVNKGCN